MQSSAPSDLKKLSEFLDSKFRIAGIRIGWDAIIGFIPGVGDLVTNLVSLYIIVRSAMLGCPPSVVLRMGLNVLLDNLFDLFPVIGNFFDIFWRSNDRNIQLLEKYQSNPVPTVRGSRFVLVFTLALITLVLLGSVFLIAWTAVWAWNFIAMNFNTP